METSRLGSPPRRIAVTTIISAHGVTPHIHSSAYVAPNATIIGSVTVAEDASIWFNVVLRGDINSISIGTRTNVQDGSIMHVTKTTGVIIGNDVTIGHRALVHACTVADLCLIGMGAILLDHSTIGKGSLVAAGAVVREGFHVPEGVLVAGVPAKIVRDLTPDEQEHIRQSAIHYVGYANEARRSQTGMDVS